MKNLLQYLTILLILSACTSTNRLKMTYNKEEQQNILALKQTLQIFQDYKYGDERKNSTNLNQVISVYILNETKDKRPEVMVGFNSKNSKRPFVTDSVLFILLNHERIRINPGVNYPYMGKSGLKTTQFIIPENLWISIVYAKSIGYLFYHENNGIMFNLDLSESQKLKGLFKRAIRLRDINFQELPEGMKKW
jgi:hypothetical protein